MAIQAGFAQLRQVLREALAEAHEPIGRRPPLQVLAQRAQRDYRQVGRRMTPDADRTFSRSRSQQFVLAAVREHLDAQTSSTRGVAGWPERSEDGLGGVSSDLKTWANT